MDSLREKIHFDEVPHFTTIHKFCQLSISPEPENIDRFSTGNKSVAAPL
jgi:hypothetical protein